MTWEISSAYANYFSALRDDTPARILTTLFGRHNNPPPVPHKPLNSLPFQGRKSLIMAEGGIDRKMEERMEFTTSKEVEIGKAEPLLSRQVYRNGLYTS